MSAVGGQAAIRLNKALCGICARRKADALIFAGRVAVNGEIEKNPARRILPEDTVEVDGKPLPYTQKSVCIMLNKPPCVVCTAKDPEGRPTVMDYVPAAFACMRLYPAGRLDFFSEGLLVLTNDGELAQKLVHPRHGHEKCYETLIRGEVPDTALAAMCEGMTLKDGTRLAPVRAAKSRVGANTMLHLGLCQGLNRQIRRMCADLGLTILKLKRISQGNLRLGKLAKGQTRILTAEEIAELL